MVHFDATSRDQRPGERPTDGSALAPHALRRLVRGLRILIIATLLLPALAFTAVAWEMYRMALRDAEKVARQTAMTIAEHVLTVFQTEELALDELAARTTTLGWDEIAGSAEVKELINRLNGGMRQFASIWLMDAHGHVRAAAAPLPIDANLVASDYFMFQKGGGGGRYVSRVYSDRPDKAKVFAVSRRRSTRDGAFDGVFVPWLAADYFESFIRDEARDVAHVAGLVRSDGEVLARDPAEPQRVRLGDDDPLIRAVAVSDEGLIWQESPVDHGEHVVAFRKIEDYPLVVFFSIARSAALRPWILTLIGYGSVIGAGMLIVVLILLVALRRVEGEGRALVRLAIEAENRREAEMRLQQAMRLEALGHLTGGVAHDFSNLLTIILGNLEEIIRGFWDADLQRRTKAALSAAWRGEKLVRSLLAFARRQPLFHRVFDLNAVIRDLEPLLRQTLGTRTEMAVHLSPDAWPVLTDVNQTEMAILNLAINARDATPTGGVLRIGTANVILSGEIDGLHGAFVALTVADTGVGMSPEVLAHAFEPFFTTKPADKGTGLGLSMVYGFAQESHGAVTIRSAQGRGTTVTIYLPRSLSLIGSATPTELVRQPGE